MANTRRRKRSKLATPRRVQAQQNKRLFKAAAQAGLPDIQRQADQLVLVDVPQIASEPTPVKETVRRLTSIEKFARSGILEPHEASACSWYVERYETGRFGCCRTSNFEGGSGGGRAHDHAARTDREIAARDDYRWARSFIPAPYVGIFEAIILSNNTITAIAAEAFADKARSRAQEKTRAVVKLCANLLFDGIKALLPIEGAQPSKPSRSAAQAVPAAKGAPAPRKPVTEAIHAKLDEAQLAGIGIAAVHLGKATAEALRREAPASFDAKSMSFRGVPVIERKAGWAVMLQLEEEPAEQAA